MPKTKTAGHVSGQPCASVLGNVKMIAGNGAKGNGMGEAKLIYEPTESRKRDPKKRSKISIALWVLTILYCVFFGWLLFQIEECTPPLFWHGLFSHFIEKSGFIERTISCRSINEIGDALAGACAPLAFLWLVGTVIIQSNELALQRAELDQTQEVMWKQLEVSKEQVKETRTSTVLFNEQTKVLKRELELREMALVKDEIEQIVLQIIKFIKNQPDLTLKIHGSTNSSRFQKEYKIFWQGMEKLTPEGLGGLIKERFHSARSFMSPHTIHSSVSLTWPPVLVALLARDLKKIYELRNEISAPHRMELNNRELFKAFSLVEALYKDVVIIRKRYAL